MTDNISEIQTRIAITFQFGFVPRKNFSPIYLTNGIEGKHNTIRPTQKQKQRIYEF